MSLNPVQHPVQPSSLKKIKLDPEAYPSDEEFTPAFLRETHVFEAKESWEPHNCFIINPTNNAYFVKHWDMDRNPDTYSMHHMGDNGNYPSILEKKEGKWEKGAIRGGFIFEDDKVEYFPTLAEASEACRINSGTLSDIQLVAGVVARSNSPHRSEYCPVYDILREIVLEQPVGTFIIVTKYTTNRSGHEAWVNVNGEKIRAFDVSDMTRYHKSIESINRTVRNKLAGHLQNYHLGHLYESLNLCQSVLDLDFLINLSPSCRQRVLSSWNAEKFQNINHIVLVCQDGMQGYHLDKTSCGQTYVDLLILLARLDRTDIMIHIVKPYTSAPVDNDSYCRAVLGRMRTGLEGRKLQWAQDAFLEVMFYNTKAETRKLVLPKEDPSWHEFYDNKSFDPNITVTLPESGEVIQVHKVILARFSDLFKIGAFKDWSEKKNGSITFPGQSDAVIEQFLRIAYGYSADFSKCSFYDLFRFADYAQSPQFMIQVNLAFDKSADNIDINDLLVIISSNIWKNLPNKTVFFHLVGTHWSIIIEGLNQVAQDSFREAFLTDWSEYLLPKKGNLIKV